jgi:hypothetical protein
MAIPGKVYNDDFINTCKCLSMYSTMPFTIHGNALESTQRWPH